MSIDSSTVLTRECPVCRTCHSGPLCPQPQSHTSMFRLGYLNGKPHSEDAEAIYFHIVSPDGGTSIAGYCTRAQHKWLMEQMAPNVNCSDDQGVKP